MAAAKKAKSESAKTLSNARKLPDAATLKKLYRDMLLIRRFEEKAGQLYGMGLIGGFCHLYIGQEAIVTGIQSVQEPQDTVITTYRDHGHMLACGMDARGVMAELTGREGGYSRGKGGSMHMFSSETKFYGGHGIVGASGALGTGLAFAHQYQGDKGVALVYMGDGAANQGQTFECMNMAALWKLPVVYVIENNQYGMGTSAARHAAGELYKRGEAFGIPGEKIDGADVLEVQAVARQVLDHVRSGKGPYVMEMNTYRFRGHSMSDPGKYRSKEELDKAKAERDPIERLRGVMMRELGMKEDDFDPFEKDIKRIVNESAEFAQQSPEPHPDELWTDVLKPVAA
ncbi:MAG: pyruvate dehydrogenase (acetyl-transferring) E1 component subunit alpha [Rhodospirillales bacterium]|nr:pyruvate dehydrogenase (acetyl-transferring) E1 component subunit alpha [Rhodospirillales bacterium]USO07728.1 MAG: pyruvate dehydrogenase (acetyl-transferring) E1 component subunit alpha [Rhodospirillales bacterium]